MWQLRCHKVSLKKYYKSERVRGLLFHNRIVISRHPQPVSACCQALMSASRRRPEVSATRCSLKRLGDPFGPESNLNAGKRASASRPGDRSGSHTPNAHGDERCAVGKGPAGRYAAATNLPPRSTSGMHLSHGVCSNRTASGIPALGLLAERLEKRQHDVLTTPSRCLHQEGNHREDRRSQS
jgi:hypothetical protein